MKIIDLSQVMKENMSLFPGTAPVTVRPISNVRDDGFKVTSLEINTHVGTHLDCKTHVYEEGFTTCSKELDFFYGRGIVIDCSDLNNDEISLDLLKKYNIEGRDFILFYTGWDKYWNTEKYCKDFPGISKELAEFIASSNIKGIGVDTVSIDKISDPNLSMHKIVLKNNNKTVIENLTNLDKLLNKDFHFSCFPLKIHNGEGSPVRAVAMINSC